MQVREIRLWDVATMVNWGTFEDSRYDHFNFPYTTQEEFELWYRYKVKGFRLRTYGVFLGEQMIGFVTFKRINWLFRRAELGVIFDRNQVGKGYGPEAIRRCMALFPLKKIYLYVSSFNSRAQRAYEKLGFVYKETVYRPFESQEIKTTEWVDGEHFILEGGQVYGKYYKMEKSDKKPPTK